MKINFFKMLKFLAAFYIALQSPTALAECNGQFINPITDVSWKCIFPMRIGGVVSLGSGEEDPSSIKSPVCACKDGLVGYIGLRTSFWEPKRIIDTVQDAWCMVPLGKALSRGDSGSLDGSVSTAQGIGGKVFSQVHYYMFPAWKMLNMFYDIPCLDSGGFDVAMLTEVMPQWNNEILSLIIHPESILFANPISAIACGADSAAAVAGMPRNELFWCMGSWGNVYPLAGSITSTDFVEANAGIAARAIYMMSRLGLLWNSSEDGCFKGPVPIWKKNRYKLQMSQPIMGQSCIPLGRESLLWGSGKHNLRQDNLSWMMFEKNDCCIRYY